MPDARRLNHQFPSSLRRSVASSLLPAFTLVEMLVVMAIIAILFASVFVAATAVLNRSRTQSTEALLAVVQNAVDEFHREQTANPTLTRSNEYRNGYGRYPPDELEVFATEPRDFPRRPKRGGQEISLAPGGAQIFPRPRYDEMKFYTKGLPPDQQALEHRDLAAMVLAIVLFGDSSASMLRGIPERNQRPGPADGNPPVPLQFLDRNNDQKWDGGDQGIGYLVDDWGTPLGYLAQRDWQEETEQRTVSSNHEGWNEGSTELIRLNRGRPVIFSYGPSGPQQLTREVMEAPDPVSGNPGTAALVVDFEDGHTVSHPMNADNIYADPALKESLAEGIPE